MLLLVMVSLFGLLASLLSYAVLGEPYRPVFRRHRLQVPGNWPALSVVHISDLHVRRGDPRLFRKQRAALAGLSPDLLCVTGDVCEQVRDIDLVIDLLKAATPRLGTFVVLGNHEHNAPLPEPMRSRHRHGPRRLFGAALHLLSPRVRSAGPEEGHAMAEALQAAGITVLDNAGQRIESDGRTLWIAGCDSAWAGHADLLAAMRGRLPREACLTLIHEPELAFQARALHADLVLAGHTHGGQVKLPLLGTPHTLSNDPRLKIAAGFQRIGAGLLHITTGLGHTIPLRFGCPPEVVWLDCTPVAAPERSAQSANLPAAAACAA